MNHDHLINNIKKSYSAKSSVHGTGLFANSSIKIGEILGVLGGERLSWEAFIKKGMELVINSEWNALPKGLVLYRKEKTRYSLINHNRVPNLKITEINGGGCIVIAISNINKGDELFFDYREETLPQSYMDSHGTSFL